MSKDAVAIDSGFSYPITACSDRVSILLLGLLPLLLPLVCFLSMVEFSQEKPVPP